MKMAASFDLGGACPNSQTNSRRRREESHFFPNSREKFETPHVVSYYLGQALAVVWATAKRRGWSLLAALALLASYGDEYPIQEGAFQVRPPADIQGAVELAAQH